MQPKRTSFFKKNAFQKFLIFGIFKIAENLAAAFSDFLTLAVGNFWGGDF